VTLLIACGCRESSGLDTSVDSTGPSSDLIAITGTVVADASVSPLQIYLLDGTDQRVNVVGSEAQRLASLDGAKVQLRGSWIGKVLPPFVHESVSPRFAITGFLVLAVGGRQAMDGVVGEEEGRYYLRLTAGNAYWFKTTPSEFKDYIGKRIWVTGWLDNSALTYGVID
jgi:hypothetical protein